MAKSKTEVNFMEHLKPLLPAGGDASELEAAAQALAGLSPEDRDLLAAVQESPFRLTTLEQFREFPANTEYFVLEPNISKVEDVGWRYLAQHLDVLLPPELLDAIEEDKRQRYEAIPPNILKLALRMRRKGIDPKVGTEMLCALLKVVGTDE